MKVFGLVFIVFFFLMTQAVFAQQKIIATVSMQNHSNNPDEIVYRKGVQLNLSDFQGEEQAGMDAVAMAYSGVSLKYSGSVNKGGVNLDIKVYASFLRSRSWCLRTSRNEWTLAHEQRHFDITGLNACALLRELNTYPFTKNFEQEIEALQEKYRKKNEEEQDIYDSETNHGINRAMQIAWNEKIIKAIDACPDCYGR